MNKIKLITITTIILFIIITIFTLPIYRYDEIWNFSYAKNISQGLLPYKDFNMITTPLSAFINNIPLNLFGQKLYIHRITYIVLFITYIYIITKILKLLNINQKKTNNYLLILTYLLINFTYNDYNFLNLILSTIIIYFELKNKNSTNKYDILIGITCSLILLTKQTTGIFYAFLSILIPIITNKNMKKSIIRLISMAPSIIIFLLFLLKNNILNDFVDLTILGIKTFKKTGTEYSFNIYNLTILIIIISIIIYLIKNIIKEKRNYNNLIILLYSLISLSLNYPLLDFTHFIISIVPTSIYFINNNKFKLKINTKEITITFIIILNFINIKNIIEYKNKITINHEFSTYQYLILPLNDLKEITDFIKNNKSKVYILDKDAIIYTTAINIYNKYFDMPLPGNIGSDGENQMIKTLKKEKNILLIYDITNIKTDLPKLYKYINKTYKKTDKIHAYNIYEKINNK